MKRATRRYRRLGAIGRKMKCLATGHSINVLPLGFVCLLIMIFIPDVNPKFWFILPFVWMFDDFLTEDVKNRHCKRLIISDPDSSITKRVKDVANLLNFPVHDIYKNHNETKIPEINYSGNLIIISENLLRLPEEIATALIAQEIELSSRRSTVPNLIVAMIRLVGLGYMLVTSFGNNEVCEVFGFDNSPYPYVPMYLAYAYIWPVFSHILNRVECLVHSWNVLKADAVVHKAITPQGINALKAVAGKAEKYPIFDTWYSQLMRGYPTVARRLKNLDAQD
ncbi:hypothetical protein GE061_013425 [Apolygus lucorum]|uniref:Ste24 endopeptidase n=1 Tax=Apolygus lucorum TaxID=248454 RepID=A0A6A4JQD9_APOLU|nr:hypothetical protein GE061_013425 [Apolygus lucorum]